MSNLRSMVLALVDAADHGGAWDEPRWAAFLELVDDAGRFVLGYPKARSTSQPLHELARLIGQTDRLADEAAVAAATDNIPRANADVGSAPSASSTFNDPPAPLTNDVVETGADHSTTIPPAPPQRKGRAVVPLAETLAECDPGCGTWLPASVLAAHRRECEAVATFKAERGVTVVPSLATAAPLPPLPESDFDAKRLAAAHEASERTWRETHLDVAEAPIPKARHNTTGLRRGHPGKRTAEQREHMRVAQIESRKRRGPPVREAAS